MIKRTAASLLLILTLALTAGDSLAGRLDQDLKAVVAAGSDSVVSVVVFLQNPSTQYAMLQAASRVDLNRAERIQSVSGRLQSDAENLMKPVNSQINNLAVGPVKRHWIIPAYSMTVKVSDLETLVNLPGVDQVISDLPIELTAPVEIRPAPSAVTSASTELQMLNVPNLWQSGITGKGRLVCSFDTGVDRLHPALSSKWRGNHATLRESFFSAVAPDSLPFDKTGHGTHTMGVMVGAVEADSFGVAPEAEWITAGVIDQGPDLSTTISHILGAFQWALNPDGDASTTDDVPDVILNSWGLPALVGSAIAPCSTLFWQALDNVEAAGVVTIFAAGNEGRFGAMSIRNPANRATTPYNSFCVGAVNSSKVIADFSSRGPSSCDTTQIKPEVVAPGVGIRSSSKNNTYVYMSGTSMAAPYIAGMVALCRQYNPDATVEQIKYAIIQSAVDLGPAGEDNAYGHGLVDASRLISFLPVPTGANLHLANEFISGDGIAMPGETVGFQAYVTNSAANLDQINGELINLSPEMLSITGTTQNFVFGTGGTMAVNSQPFTLNINPSVVHGSVASMRLRFRSMSGQLIDSASIELTLGIPVPGNIVTHVAGSLAMSVSEFGEYGLSAGSIYNAGGNGFRLNGGDNLLFEAGIMVGRSSAQLSTATRDSLGRLKDSDFRPPTPGSASWVNDGSANHNISSFSDNNSALPIPIAIRQESVNYTEAEDDGFIIVKYQVTNSALEPLTGLHFGLLTDFDISATDTVEIVSGLNLAIHRSQGAGPMTGLVALSGGWFSVKDNGTAKAGMTRQQQYAVLSTHAHQPDMTAPGDKMVILHSGSFTLGPQGSTEVALAFVAANSREELIERATRARMRYDVTTSVDNDELLPNQFDLRQNYPNPFNPSTTISFALSTATEVSLDIYNLLGQRVVQLVNGPMTAGEHRIIWEGTDGAGSSVAAGVYFYRLTAGNASESRKMVLLK
ncbi:MAG: S8 family peptidase [bacterium]|nr:S8 family peptidase [bacterium]